MGNACRAFFFSSAAFRIRSLFGLDAVCEQHHGLASQQSVTVRRWLGVARLQQVVDTSEHVLERGTILMVDYQHRLDEVAE